MKKVYWSLALSILLLAGCTEKMESDAERKPSVNIINEVNKKETHLTNEEKILNESVVGDDEEHLNEKAEIEQNLSDIEELEKEVNETLVEFNEIEKNLQELDDLIKELEDLTDLDQDLAELEELLKE
jgi:PBP1b-binding outer membrane lipoprotein LpoB